jgi:3'(2'), 5'-bisphosphate nucleotidase
VSGPGEEIEALTPGVLEAGRLIMEIYETEFAHRTKDDDSPITHADEGAETILLAALAQVAPGVPVISEEEAAAGRIPPVGRSFFLVDPLDGTKEFLARNGEFTVNVARIENGRAVSGLVYAPAHGRLFAGDANGAFERKADAHLGAAALDQGAWRPISARPVRAPAIALWSRSHDKWRGEEYRNLYDIERVTIMGSSLKFCLIAAGEADLYPRHGPTMEWDTAAGQAVLEAAGGSVRLLNGQALGYGKTADGYKNPHFVARGR